MDGSRRRHDWSTNGKFCNNSGTKEISVREEFGLNTSDLPSWSRAS